MLAVLRVGQLGVGTTVDVLNPPSSNVVLPAGERIACKIVAMCLIYMHIRMCAFACIWRFTV
jgi:hypothetical protein